MPFPLSDLRMAKSFDNALKIRILLIGKTERNFATRLSEHSDPQKSSISKHLSECGYPN